jgi:flagellar hook-length control protein FliK
MVSWLGRFCRTTRLTRLFLPGDGLCLAVRRGFRLGPNIAWWDVARPDVFRRQERELHAAIAIAPVDIGSAVPQAAASAAQATGDDVFGQVLRSVQDAADSPGGSQSVAGQAMGGSQRPEAARAAGPRLVAASPDTSRGEKPAGPQKDDRSSVTQPEAGAGDTVGSAAIPVIAAEPAQAPLADGAKVPAASPVATASQAVAASIAFGGDAQETLATSGDAVAPAVAASPTPAPIVPASQAIASGGGKSARVASRPAALAGSVADAVAPEAVSPVGAVLDAAVPVGAVSPQAGAALTTAQPNGSTPSVAGAGAPAGGGTSQAVTGRTASEPAADPAKASEAGPAQAAPLATPQISAVGTPLPGASAAPADAGGDWTGLPVLAQQAGPRDVTTARKVDSSASPQPIPAGLPPRTAASDPGSAPGQASPPVSLQQTEPEAASATAETVARKTAAHAASDTAGDGVRDAGEEPLPQQIAPPDALSAAPETAATPATASAHPAQAAAPVAQLAPALVTLAKTVDGAQQMTVRLHPADLGMVQVRIQRAASGVTQIDITADKPATLQALQRDQAALHRTLDQAGVPAAGRTVSFHAAAPAPAPASSGSSTSGQGGGQHPPAGRTQNGNADTGSSGGGGRGGSYAREARSWPSGRQPQAASGATAAADTRTYRVGLDITA